MSSPQTITLIQPPSPRLPGVLRIAKKGHTHHYLFREIPCDLEGRGFAMHKLGLGALYHVRVAAPWQSTCECLGFLRHGRCKHVQGLSALIGHGLL